MSDTIAIIETRAGKEAARIVMTQTAAGRALYRWAGAWGAGCGDLQDIISTIRSSMNARRGWRITKDDCGLATHCRALPEQISC